MPPRILGQISRGEFINFDTLLTASTSGMTDTPFTVTVQQGDEEPQAMRLSQQKSRIHGFASWLAAWNIYLNAYSHYHAHMTSQLLHYQTTITRFNQSYPIPAWWAYDIQFLQSRANDPTLRWDVIDEVIATDVLRIVMQQGSTAALPSPVTCYRCRRRGHLGAQCFATLRNS